MMGFSIKKVDKLGNDSVIEQIRDDYHNGDCEFLLPASYTDELRDDLRYLVVDHGDYMILVYPN